MEDSLNILIPFGYDHPTQADIQTGKNYVLRRESAVRGLSSLIDALLKEAAEKITLLCYQYNIDPRTFQITSKYNEKLFEAIATILDKLEDDIYELVLNYATRCTESEKRKKNLLAWLVLLGRDNYNLRQTLEKRLWSFSRDLEAMIVTMRLYQYDSAKAVTKIKSNLHTVYAMPEMKTAFTNAQHFKATYIKTKGVKQGNVGSSNSEANNIDRFGKTTVQMSWMRNLRMNYEEKGAAGYVVLRGSNFPCNLCDSKTGWHEIEDTDSFPPFHTSCCCYTIPLFKTENK